MFSPFIQLIEKCSDRTHFHINIHDQVKFPDFFPVFAYILISRPFPDREKYSSFSRFSRFPDCVGTLHVVRVNCEIGLNLRLRDGPIA